MDSSVGGCTLHSTRESHVEGPIAQSLDDESTIDILFVHGVTCKWQQTWSDRSEQSRSWIKDLLPREISKVQIWACGFDVRNYVRNEESDVFSDACITLFEEFERKRSHAKRPVIFVAHSLGGIILQAFLLECARDSSLLTSIRGIVFFGTPNYGFREKSWLDLFTAIDKVQNEVSDLISLPNPCLQGLQRTNDTFQEWLPQQAFAHRVVCLYETLPLSSEGSLIVERESAIQTDCDAVALRADHLGMSKFSAPSDVQYQIVVQILRSIYCLAEKNLSVLLNHSIGPSSHGRLRNVPSTPDGCEEFIASPRGSLNARESGLYALVLEDQGWFDDAEAKYREALESLDESPGSDHPIALFCQDKLATMLRNRCEYNDAVALSLKCVERRVQVSGKGSFPTLLSAGNLALAMRHQGKYHETYSFLRDALENSDSDANMSLLSLAPHVYLSSILAKIVMECGWHDMAESLFCDAVRKASALYGDRHPYTLNRLSDMAVIIALQGNMPGAEAITRQALDGLEQALGTDHPHCLRSSRRLADFLRFQRRYDEASARLKEILKIQKIRPGSSHPDTLSTMSSLGAVYALQGYLIDAEVLLRKAHKGQEICLPCEHASIKRTVRAMEGLKVLKDSSVALDEDLPPKTLEYFGPRSELTPKHNLLKNHHTSSAFGNSSESQVISAAMAGDQIKIDELISAETQGEGVTSLVLGRALREAAANHHEGLVLSLLDSSVNVDDLGGFHGTALQAASYAGSITIVRLLLDRKADINAKGGIFGNAVRAAILGRHPDIVLLLLDHLPQQDVLDSSMSSAIATKQQKIVQLLLDKGANSKAEDPIFGTPLQQASFSGQQDIVQLLLGRNADANMEAGLIGSPLQSAIVMGQRSVIKQLRASGAKFSSHRTSSGSQTFWGYSSGAEAFLTEILLEFPRTPTPAGKQTKILPAPAAAAAATVGAAASSTHSTIPTTSHRNPVSNTNSKSSEIASPAPVTHYRHNRPKSGVPISSKPTRMMRPVPKGLRALFKRTKGLTIYLRPKKRARSHR